MTPSSRWRTALAVLCAGVLLLAGYVHAAHFCASPGTSQQQSLVNNNVDRGSAQMPCALCISLHAPSLAAPTISLFSGGASSAAVVDLQPVFCCGVQGFALHVRPPPAA